MKSRSACVLIALLAALTVSLRVTAQDVHVQPHQYHHYQLNDVGAFGGPQSFLSLVGGLARAGIRNNQGTFTGCYTTHAFQ
jgi:hypothetical protein